MFVNAQKFFNVDELMLYLLFVRSLDLPTMVDVLKKHKLLVVSALFFVNFE
jgi:hypothetical protein